MTSSRHQYQSHSHYTASTPRNKHGSEKTVKRKTPGLVKKKGGSQGLVVSSGTSTLSHQSHSSGRGERGQGTEKNDRFTTHAQDSGYSSGGAAGHRGLLPASAVKTSDNGLESALNATAVLSGSPSLSHPASCVPIPATITSLQLTEGRRKGEERERLRVLEQEVAVLEQQLSEKTQAARNHVEELTCTRSELARERATLARVRYIDQLVVLFCCVVGATREPRESWGAAEEREGS